LQDLGIKEYAKPQPVVHSLSTMFILDNPNLPEKFAEIDLPGTNSLNYLRRVRQAIGRTAYCGLYGVTIVRGEKDKIYDADGNEYIDCLSGASVNILGYGVGLEKIYAEQARTIQHTCFPYSPNIPAINLAEKLIQITPGSHNKRVIFGLTGSDGCDCAIEAMRKFTHKHVLISFSNSYHGTTGLSEPASGFDFGREVYEENSALFLKHYYPTSNAECDIVLKRIENDLSAGGIGGILIEPIQGDGGIIIPASGFLARLSRLLKKYGALLMVDEVQSGMGRTGNW
jgi:4-aminobutyrate aminotransferase-like enzyme